MVPLQLYSCQTKHIGHMLANNVKEHPTQTALSSVSPKYQGQKDKD